ncbi:hypothetical protein [Spirosoma utsteinense]|uniref:Sortilin N-terminal domain-containing protein n=1 Tax=Spirosoma utsteinense TaxID=2585773 RepID=A0ABR6WEB4_9BACT|nr:hypothetical protein [Spirosoma utsteinense]MBC3794894.1 photosystem II stability/assembly factor-like putative protein [Spirosoma utsteinense]
MFRKLRQMSLVVLLGATGASAQLVPVPVFKQMKARSVGPAVMGGRITAIDAVVSNPDVIYVGAASGGVWKSENAGGTWTPVFDEQPTINIGSLAIQQSNPNVIWVGTGEGNPRNSVNMGGGIFKSIDGGLTWKSMGLEKTINIHRIIIDPSNPDVVYAGVIGFPFGEHPERGVFKTTNGGQTWERILYTNEKSGVAEMVMDPANPSKLVVAMWQHRRTPWDFSSGGPGSGLYITYDGGKTWKKKGEADGLPKGDFGRLGLAISRSSPNKIYALVEAPKNGLYRSDDGGEKWTLVTDDPTVATDRPFYYNEIYVDPKVETRIYKLSAPLSVSEDGGKSFKVLATPDQVHSDHHAFWIHPENPNLIIEGNDGGLSISRDHGKSWTNPEAIPVGQFYHVNVDNEIPYNIYGGLQDNGSWTGPAYTFHTGGIRNSHWQALILADGFDVIPDPEDSRFGYAMSQGGNIIRYDKVTGGAAFVKPIVGDMNTRLRFNWNTGFAQDPADKKTIYAGSQFVHKSTDKGMTWETISPDLILNDPAHQKQDDSGGLTIDATQAENHNTILTIAPSPLQKGVIWVGTDDGNVQLTQDGGKTWTNLSSRLPGFPKEAWVAQITASRHKAGEAFVVANLYRMGTDMAPYIYRTTNFGQSWTRILSEKEAKGYALCFMQDPTEPRLMFAGTEHGLWVSIDEGKSWAQWNNGMPAATPVMDLAIQEREADLVIGTFGRSIYVLDNIRPLRRLAATGGKILDQQLVAFEPSTAYQAIYRGQQGYGKDAEDLFQAPNRPVGALLPFYLKPKKGIASKAATPAEAPVKARKPVAVTKPDESNVVVIPTSQTATTTSRTKVDSVYISLYDERNTLVRTLKQAPDTAMGMQRVNWNLTETAIAMPSMPGPRRGGGDLSGNPVMPGKYKVVITYAGARDSTFVLVDSDPRVPFNKEAALARRDLQNRLNKKTIQLNQVNSRIQEASEAAEVVKSRLKEKKGPEFDDLRKATLAIQDSLKVIRERIVGKRNDRQGFGRVYMITPVMKLQEAGSYISRRTEPPTKTETQLVDQVEMLTGETLTRVNEFFSKQWAEYYKKVQATPLEVIKEYAPMASSPK